MTILSSQVPKKFLRKFTEDESLPTGRQAASAYGGQVRQKQIWLQKVNNLTLPLTLGVDVDMIR